MIRERLSWVGHRIVGSGGTSKLNRVVHSDTVNKKAVEAIRSVSKKPHGIFCVDLKEDAKSVPCPTEINCRFTTNVHYLSLASIRLGHPEWNFAWLAARLALEEEIPDCSKTNAIPDDLWFTKNTDMGFTMVRGNHWKAAEVFDGGIYFPRLWKESLTGQREMKSDATDRTSAMSPFTAAPRYCQIHKLQLTRPQGAVRC